MRGQNAVEAFKGEGALAVKKVGDVSLLEAGLMGEAAAGEGAALDAAKEFDVYRGGDSAAGEGSLPEYELSGAAACSGAAGCDGSLVGATADLRRGTRMHTTARTTMGWVRAYIRTRAFVAHKVWRWR